MDHGSLFLEPQPRAKWAFKGRPNLCLAGGKAALRGAKRPDNHLLVSWFSGLKGMCRRQGYKHFSKIDAGIVV